MRLPAGSTGLLGEGAIDNQDGSLYLPTIHEVAERDHMNAVEKELDERPFA
jgi:hypothetical protein